MLRKSIQYGHTAAIYRSFLEALEWTT